MNLARLSSRCVYSKPWHWRWCFIAKIPLTTAFHRKTEIFRLFWSFTLAKNTRKEEERDVFLVLFYFFVCFSPRLALISILMNRFSTSSVFLSFLERACWLWSVYTHTQIHIQKHNSPYFTLKNTHTHTQSSIKSKYGPESNSVEKEKIIYPSKTFSF